MAMKNVLQFMPETNVFWFFLKNSARLAYNCINTLYFLTLSIQSSQH